MLEQIFDNLTRALSLEIDAIRQRGGESVVEVHEGERAGGGAAGGPGDRLYRFSMPEDQMLREDIPIKMVVAGEEVDGAVVSVEEGGVIVSIEKDLGDTIPFARIVSDNSFLAERLRDRLRKVAGGGEQFNAVKALQAIGQAEIRGAPDEKASVDSGSMNAEQELAVRTALGCETAIIWGPPGTGKTTTLAAVIEALYRRRQRILVVSNTNLAVDTLIEKVGDRLRGGEEFEKRNAVLRYGAMVKPELLEKYQRQMDLFGAVNRIGNEFARARSSAKAKLEKIRVASTRLKRMVRGEEKATVPNPAAALEEISNRALQIQTEMKEAEQRQANLKDQVLETSRIVATTAHQVYLKPKDFRDFDVVVIDEASMLQLAIVFYVAGLAKKRLVITGDFRQLPPIVASDREEVKEWLGKTVFEHAGILKAVNKGLNPVHMVPLRTQYRMAPEICALINDTFYRGILRTGPEAGHTKRSSDLFGKRIAIVDTSFRGPAVGVKQGTFSRYNLLHATVVRNLVHHLLREGYAGQNDVMDAIGVITPYAAQSQLINRAIEELGTIEAPIASTVHRYQGNEKDLIVIDITDGWGTRPSRFVAADSIDEDGAKLMNVALSRARSQLVIVANLKYLETRLKEEAILRTVLGQARKEGQVIAADDLLRLGPDVEGDWKANMRVNKAAFDWTKAHLYNKTNVSGPLEKDLEGAKKSIVIFSSKTTAEGVARWRPLLGRKVAEGVTVRVVTRPPASQGDANAGLAVDELLSAGAIVDLRQDIGEKIVLIDGSVIWHGSLDPLAHDGRLNDSLIRYASKALSAVMSGFVSIARLKGQGYVPAGEAMAVRENDPCDSCGALSVLRHGPQGHYFECSRKCGWQLDIRKAGGAAMTDSERAALSGADVSELLGGEPGDGSDSGQPEPDGTETRNCKECGSEMKLKNGRYGPFWGCSAYPKCRHIEKAA